MLAQQAAIREVKARLRSEGRVKLSNVPNRQIVAMAEGALIADAEYRFWLTSSPDR